MRIVVTRAQAQADSLAERLEALGHEVVRCPLIEVEPLGDEPVDPGPYDWVVVTSPNGAAQLARRLAAPPRRLAAIGPGTAAELRAHGLEPELVPRVPTQEGLLAELPRPAGRVLFAAAEGARRLLADELGADFLPLYRTVELRPETTPAGDLAVLASPSAARALAATGARLPVVAIGPQTAASARAAGLHVVAEARTHDLEGILAAVASLADSPEGRRPDRRGRGCRRHHRPR
ncbi:MAG: uroporphyrinogen-III synthase [Gaiellaceae bacterium]|jgi:uroporphyrinogen-III synthase